MPAVLLIVLFIVFFLFYLMAVMFEQPLDKIRKSY